MLLWNQVVDVIRESMFAYAQVRDIARPDPVLALAVAAVTAASLADAAQTDLPAQQRQLLAVLPAVFTALALWHMAAGIGLYWGVSSTLGVAQGLVVRRILPRRPA